MGRNILIILGHPDEDSFCGVLAEEYTAGAERAGAAVRTLMLGKLRFDPILHRGYRVIQKLEPDLVRAQKDIRWADHLVFVYPMWWGSMPAVLKGFLDRAFLPGFAFKFHDAESYLWTGLLKGRSARMMITMDGPPIAIKLLYRSPAVEMMRGMTLEFCGIRPVHVNQFGSIKRATRARKILWKIEAEELGYADGRG
jgi:putative NADPH-quinone reductase